MSVNSDWDRCDAMNRYYRLGSVWVQCINKWRWGGVLFLRVILYFKISSFAFFDFISERILYLLLISRDLFMIMDNLLILSDPWENIIIQIS